MAVGRRKSALDIGPILVEVEGGVDRSPTLSAVTEIPVLTITPKARSLIRDVLANEPDREQLALLIRIDGVRGIEFSYDMGLIRRDDTAETDLVYQDGDLWIALPEGSVANLRGAELGASSDLLQPGLKMTNPNRPSPRIVDPSLPPPVLEGPVAERVARVIAEQINPSIAMHGGAAELVSVDGSTAYVKLSGGCQGCGMAQVTLSQGIEAAIRRAVPEVTQILDVTNHASGTDPYYQQQKK